MKKFFMIVTSLVLLLAMVLTGCDCSCSSTPSLSFKNNFVSDVANAKVGYKETLTYNVSYNAEGTDYPELAKNVATDSVIDKDGIKYEGFLETTFEIGGVNAIPQGVNSEILSAENVASDKITEIYIFKTKLNLTATYNFKDQEQPSVVTDVIDTTVYFLPASLSFAPIYSSYVADMHAFALTSTSKLTHVKYNYQTTYGLEEFTIVSNVSAISDTGEEFPSPQDIITEEYDYKCSIDNNQLLFALRNYETSSEQTSSLSVISPAYREATDLMFTAHTTANSKLFFVEGASEEETLPVKSFSMSVNDQNASGIRHYFTVQTGASSSGTFNSQGVLVKFAQPLFDYSTMTCMGGLEFSLSSVK